MKTNQQIRQEISAQRDAIAPPQALEEAARATSHLINSNLFLSSEHIACYLPVRSEFNTCGLVEKIWAARKKCYIPVVDPARPGYMSFALYEKNDSLVKNQFDIPEPTIRARRIPVWALSLVVLPLVAFDEKGNRLGSGCGFYDRVFANVKNWGHVPTLCGFAHSVQKATFKVEAWDVPMDAVATEEGFKIF